MTNIGTLALNSEMCGTATGQGLQVVVAQDIAYLHTHTYIVEHRHTRTLAHLHTHAHEKCYFKANWSLK